MSAVTPTAGQQSAHDMLMASGVSAEQAKAILHQYDNETAAFIRNVDEWMPRHLAASTVKMYTSAARVVALVVQGRRMENG